MARASSAIILLPLLAACQSGIPNTSKEQLAASVTTVTEVARGTNLTIFANENHSNGNQCFHTVMNQWTMNHPGVCANHYGHGGEWKMEWKALCERQTLSACEESYPVLTGRTRNEVRTWKGVNEHSHSIVDYASCGRWSWGSSWEGANFGDCQSKGDVLLSSGTGQEHATATVGVGYAAKHAEDQIVIAPAVFLTAEGPGAGAGIEFSYRDQSWGNGFEVQCEYKCDWASSTQEVVLMEKCWKVGLEDSDEASSMQTFATQLTYDAAWHELRRAACTEDDDDGSGDGTSDDTGDDTSDDTSSQDAGGGGGQDAGGGGGQDGGGGGTLDSGLDDPDPLDAGGIEPDGGSGGNQDGGSGGNQDGGSGGNQDGGSGGNQDGGSPPWEDGGPVSTLDAAVDVPQDAGAPSHDGGTPQPQDAGTAPLDGGINRDPRTPIPTEPTPSSARRAR